MEKFSNMFEQVLLLGLIPILGGSRNMLTALIVAVVLILVSLLVRFFSRIMNKENLAGAHWILYISLGISLSYIAYLFSAFSYPEVYQYSGIYILLVGVTPLTYYGCKSNITLTEQLKRYNIFFLTIIVVSFFRELLGFGSLLGISFFEVGFAPLGSFQGAPGAFIILGTLWLLFRLLLTLNIIDETFIEIEEGIEQ